MKRLAVIPNLLLLLVSLAAGQASGNAAEIRNLEVVRNGDQLQVEIILSSPVTPSVITATGPDRLVLELPNTSSDARQKRLPINRDGVKAVRFGLNTATPPLTHVVVDLDSARAYQLATEGNKVILTVLAVPSFARTGHGNGAPPAAAASPIMGRLHPQPKEALPTVANTPAPSAVTPPAALPPLRLPQAQSQTAVGNATIANSRPTAKHPNFGSLQQGTVFPSMGNPGDGSVPIVRDVANQISSATTSTASSNTIPAVAVVASMGNTSKSAPANPRSPAPIAVVAATPPSQPSAIARPIQSQAANPAPTVAVVAAQPNVGTTVAASPAAAASIAKPPSDVPSKSSSMPVESASAAVKATLPAATTVVTQPSSVASSSVAPMAAAGTSGAASVQPQSSQTVTTVGAVPASQPNASATGAPVQPASVTVVPSPVAEAAARKLQPSLVASNATIPVKQVPQVAAVTASAPISNPPAAQVTTQKPQPNATANTAIAASQPTQTSTPQATAAAVASTTLAANSQPPANSQPVPAVAASTDTPAAAKTATSTQPAAPTQPVMMASVPAAAAGPTAAHPLAEGMGIVPIPTLAIRQPNADIRMSFKVKYVTEGAAYLDGGRSAGLAEGMKLEVYESNPALARPGVAASRGDAVVAELHVISVAETSAVSEIHEPKRDVKAGDLAYLTTEDTETLVAQRSLSATRKYPTVISFTAGDPLDEEARAEVPHPPLPEINRARGRIGFDYSGVMTHGAVSSLSSSMGLSVRTDFTRIGGTYWNMSGYWRGRFTQQSGGPQTLQDLINRTYHLGLTYDNPNSPWVAGIGRLYLPWATSLDTIDGGYFGRHVTKGTILGIFAGSTPDPTSYSYNPDRRIGGAFLNFEGGSFDAFRYTSTSGIGISTLKWKIDRPFIFFENGIYYKRFLSIYDSLQADSPAGNPAVPAPGPGISRSFLTFRIQPVSRFEFDVNHTYFRDIPTFDPTLVGTGLLDKYLFQGFSAGPRIEVLKEVWLYSTIGRSSRSGDTSSSLNQLYGINFGHLPWTRIRADVHWSKFSSSFGSGKYSSISISRSFHDSFRWELLGGYQTFNSALLTRNSSHFATANLEAPVGRHYFFQGGFTWNRGGSMNYDQVLFSFGYRFDSRNNRK